MLLAILGALVAENARAAEPFELREGDRIVILGEAIAEREQQSGYWETEIVRRHPGKKLTIRNLAWSGDTVFGHARAIFGSPADGFRDLQAQVRAVQPTVLVLCYGMTPSFEGEAGVAPFIDGYRKLLASLSDLKARVIIVSPIEHEKLPPPLPDPTEHNRQVEAIVAALSKLAAEEKATFVDLFHIESPAVGPLTSDGLQPTTYGYSILAQHFGNQLFGSPAEPQITIDLAKSQAEAVGAKVVLRKAEGPAIELTYQVEQLPPALVLLAGKQPATHKLTVTGLAAGRYELRAGDRVLAQASADELAKGKAFLPPSQPQTHALREAIVTKNSHYFHRWRPQNWTYLFGFRKHEQGNNAVEIPEFEKIVAAHEAEVHALQVPREVVLTLSPVR